MTEPPAVQQVASQFGSFGRVQLKVPVVGVAVGVAVGVGVGVEPPPVVVVVVVDGEASPTPLPQAEIVRRRAVHAPMAIVFFVKFKMGTSFV